MRTYDCLNSFHCSALKAGSSTKVHIPEWARGIFVPSTQTNSLPGYIPIPNLHIRQTQSPPRHQVLNSSQARIGGHSLSMPQHLCRPQIQEHEVLKQTGNFVFPWEDVQLARLTIPGFSAHSCSWPGGVMLVWEPHALPANWGFESHR